MQWCERLFIYCISKRIRTHTHVFNSTDDERKSAYLPVSTFNCSCFGQNAASPFSQLEDKLSPWMAGLQMPFHLCLLFKGLIPWCKLWVLLGTFYAEHSSVNFLFFWTPTVWHSTNFSLCCFKNRQVHSMSLPSEHLGLDYCWKERWFSHLFQLNGISLPTLHTEDVPLLYIFMGTLNISAKGSFVRLWGELSLQEGQKKVLGEQICLTAVSL